jgi:pSer/pThr/pTyr-binding forkhead associated (FHA) protein
MILEISDESQAKQKHQFDTNVVILGRSPSADLQLLGEGISRKHLKIEEKDGKFFVTDLGSSNGVFINETKIPADTPVEVALFFPIRIGVNTQVFIQENESVAIRIPNRSSSEVKGVTGSITKIEAKNNSATTTRLAKPSATKNNESMKYLVIILILAAIAYYWFNQEESLPDGGTPVTQATPQPKAPKNDLNAIYSKLNSFQREDIGRHQKIYSGKGCQSDIEKKICDALLIDNTNDKVIASDGVVSIYMEDKSFIKDPLVSGLETSSTGELTEISMAIAGFRAAVFLSSETKRINIILLSKVDNIDSVMTRATWINSSQIPEIAKLYPDMTGFLKGVRKVSLEKEIKPYTTHIVYFRETAPSNR